MAKWDIKDGFWRLEFVASEEWNFAHIFPLSVGKDTQLVIPTSLQMGWIESPLYFCTASETARDVTAQYAEPPLGAHTDHPFLQHTRTDPAFAALPEHLQHYRRWHVGTSYTY